MNHRLAYTMLIICIAWISVTISGAASSTATLTHPFVQQDKLLASDKASGAEFGAVVVLSKDGQIMVVGAPLHDVGTNSNQGQVYVFRRNDTVWTEVQKLIASDGAAGDKFGTSIAIADTPDYTIVIGAPDDDTDTYTDLGSAYIFTFDSSTWSQQAKLEPEDENLFSYDNRGQSVAISVDGNTVFIGTLGVRDGHGNTPGAVYVFTQIDSTWSQMETIQGPTGGAAGLGSAMTLSDDGTLLLVRGVYSPSGPVIAHGVVRIYQESGGAWSEIATLKPSDGVAFDDFGLSVAISDDNATILVGAPNVSDGQVYMFTKSEAIWVEQMILTHPQDSLYSKFGKSVALDSTGTKAAVGAWLNGSGAIHRLEWSGSTWDHLQELTTADSRSEKLGFAIGMSKDGNVIAGGAKSAHPSTEVYDMVGAVYVFVPGFEVYLPIIVKRAKSGCKWGESPC